MRVLVRTDWGPGNGVFHYRVNAPLVEAQYQGLLTWRYTNNLTAELVAEADVVVGHLMNHPRSVAMWEAAGGAGRVLVSEYDDDYLNIRADNPTFGGSQADYEEYLQHNVPAVRHALEISDLVTVSVPYLADRLREHTDAPVVVLPNTVDEVLLEIPQRTRRPGEQLQVGWGGSATHTIDWRMAADGVRYGLTKAGARLTVMGADFRPLIGYRDAIHVPWADAIDQYYLALTGFHVILAPLADDDFNRAKSPLKALEAAALGIPVVASDAGPYRDFVRHGETGFLCRTDDDWMKALRTLANDEEQRQEMGRRGRELAAGLTTQKWANEWVAAYRTALTTKTEG